MTEDDLNERLLSGQKTLMNRTYWAKTHLLKAGLIDQPARGFFKINKKGEQFLKKYPDRIDMKILSQVDTYRDFSQLKSDKSSDISISEKPIFDNIETAKTPEELIESSLRQIEKNRIDSFIDLLFSIEEKRRYSFFEMLVLDLLSAMGYGGGNKDAVKGLGKTADGGVDGVIYLDILGLDRVLVQAKCYKDTKVDVGAVRDFSGALDDKKSTRGVFITSSSFTAKSHEYVKGIQKSIVLIDGEKLANLCMQYNIGFQKDKIIELKKIDEDYFNEE